MTHKTFIEKLNHCWDQQHSYLCVGLDPDITRFPTLFENKKQENAIYEFCKQIIDATASFVCAFKPQIAYFSALRAESQLETIIDYIHNQYPHIPVILDAKRGDIGSTAQQYAREVFERYKVDAVTVNPYMGFDSIAPYLEYPEKGVIALCRTSNAGGGDFQSLIVEKNSKPLYQYVAELAVDKWNTSGQICLVVGATCPDELKEVRHIVGEMPLLIPGIGAQGGDIEKTVKAARTATGRGMMINSSRAILYASKNEDFESAAKKMAQETRNAINKANCDSLLKEL